MTLGVLQRLERATDMREHLTEQQTVVQPPVEPGKALALALRHRRLDAALEVSREVTDGAFRVPTPRLRPEELVQCRLIPGAALVVLARSVIPERPLDELRNPEFVNPLQVHPERGAAVRGELRDLRDAHRVVEQRRAWLGEPPALAALSQPLRGRGPAVNRNRTGS